MTLSNFSRPRRASEGQAAHKAFDTLSVVSEREDEDVPLPTEPLPSEPSYFDPLPTEPSFDEVDVDERGYDSRMRPQRLGLKDQRYTSNRGTGTRDIARSASHIPQSLERVGYSNPTLPIPPDSPQPEKDSSLFFTLSPRRSNVSSREGNMTTARRSGSSSRNGSTSTTGPSTTSRSSNSSTRPPPSDRSSSTSTTGSTKLPFIPKSILKVTTVEQTIERSSSRSVSAAGSNKSSDSGAASVTYDSDGNFVASEYDTSELSEMELKKLKKKGINPALAMEMKALRKGKTFGSLMGNSYVS
ncbi:uncharacterized protein RCC_06768 [Ramularia collo-cygni]|uniref:Uncharacterized protein n=1 Tax=Ramularia collo-cygni TaxID=112498 RepID=A0A2D3UZI2_9PEZI|nr:uncharacterized protein RCC_06768 [Ramularia collo-cygni]CZT20908.1 uncharacterized protein RCC_06768 [Ramularia collo-cygni]